MTSANVTHYEIYYADTGEMIETARQHALCKDSISEVLERWEKEHPHAVLRLRWPDEHEVDQYLLFEDPEYFDDDYSDFFWADEKDTVRLTSFMRVRRMKAIASEKHMTQYLREKLWEYTGDPRCEDYDERKAFHEFQSAKRKKAKELGDDVRAMTSVNDGNFSSAFWLKIRSEREVKIAKEAIAHYLSTGRVPTYDEPYPQEEN